MSFRTQIKIELLPPVNGGQLVLEKTSVSTPKEYSPVSNNPPLLINFWIFCRIPPLPLLLSYLDPPSPPPPYQFSRFCFADISELVKTDCSKQGTPKTCQWDRTRRTRRWIHKRVRFLKQLLVLTLLRFVIRNVLFCFI